MTLKNQLNVNLNDLKKVRSKLNVAEIYLTSTKWDTKDVDGVTFIPVLKQKPDGTLINQILWMRKDNMELVR